MPARLITFEMHTKNPFYIKLYAMNGSCQTLSTTNMNKADCIEKKKNSLYNIHCNQSSW